MYACVRKETERVSEGKGREGERSKSERSEYLDVGSGEPGY